jgi:hypothetical protein
MKKFTLAAASALTLALAAPMVAQAGGHRGGGAHFDKIDTNSDGVVTRVEAETAALAVFTTADADADGFVTQDELKASHEAKRAEMKAKWAEKMEGKEPRKPRGERDPAKMEARKAKMAEKAAERFAAADTDGDGKWSQSEFLTTHLARFEKVDTDSDGNITAAERDAAKAMMKERRGKWRDKPADQ